MPLTGFGEDERAWNPARLLGNRRVASRPAKEQQRQCARSFARLQTPSRARATAAHLAQIGPRSPDFDDDALPPTSFDLFVNEAAEAGATTGAGDDSRVHLRAQQRNGRKTLTTVQGLSKGYDYAKVLRDLKRELCCNGTVIEDKELGNDIQLQGDHRKKVAAIIAKAGLAKMDCIKVHGF
ncbi:protein translation factor SUI1 homolog 1-like [Lolium perenne]|uniref:protein translation factor SUI1 homolog 1-like n=1 Tax=Lolium perenne TaxID=4522 RepID=UPI0021EB1606|nr:protein translation factor SUI1 homolog 1-like [Lolium perenne]